MKQTYFFEKAWFACDFRKSKVGFIGNHLGKKWMKAGKIRLNKPRIEGKIKRYSLGDNLKKIFEGATDSFEKIKILSKIIDEDKLKEKYLEEPSIETLLPFVAFS